MVVNQSLLDFYGDIGLQHLTRIGYDLAPLLKSCDFSNIPVLKPFKLLKFQTKREDFKEVVCQNWIDEAEGDIFVQLKHKQKRTKVVLSKWRKENFEDIFKQLDIREEIVIIKEDLLRQDPNPSCRVILQQAHVE